MVTAPTAARSPARGLRAARVPGGRCALAVAGPRRLRPGRPARAGRGTGPARRHRRCPPRAQETARTPTPPARAPRPRSDPADAPTGAPPGAAPPLTVRTRSDPPPGRPAALPVDPAGADLVLVAGPPGAQQPPVTLVCDWAAGTPSGTHPQAAQACADLLAALTAGDPFAPVAPDAMCTQQYGGDAVVAVSGAVLGRRRRAGRRRRRPTRSPTAARSAGSRPWARCWPRSAARCDRGRPARRPGRYLSSRDSRRSASGLPPVWQVGQYWNEVSVYETSATVVPHTSHG